MPTPEDTFERTMHTKDVLDAFRALKHYQELINSDVDSDTAFLQAFWGVYYLVPPVPRPDFLQTISDLYRATKEAHSHVTQLKAEAEEALAFLEELMKHQK